MRTAVFCISQALWTAASAKFCSREDPRSRGFARPRGHRRKWCGRRWLRGGSEAKPPPRRNTPRGGAHGGPPQRPTAMVPPLWRAPRRRRTRVRRGVPRRPGTTEEHLQPCDHHDHLRMPTDGVAAPRGAAALPQRARERRGVQHLGHAVAPFFGPTKPIVKRPYRGNGSHRAAPPRSTRSSSRRCRRSGAGLLLPRTTRLRGRG